MRGAPRNCVALIAMSPDKNVDAAVKARSVWPIGPCCFGVGLRSVGGLFVLSPAPRSASGFGAIAIATHVGVAKPQLKFETIQDSHLVPP